jgi:hypothetical protein
VNERDRNPFLLNPADYLNDQLEQQLGSWHIGLGYIVHEVVYIQHLLAPYGSTCRTTLDKINIKCGTRL